MRAGRRPEEADPDAVPALRTAELAAVAGADATIVHSSAEAAYLARAVPQSEIRLIPWHVPLHTPLHTPLHVPLGPIPLAPPPPLAGRRGVGFIGSYGHPPNLDAALELIERIMPLVWAADPTIPCLLAGADLPEALHRAAARAPAASVRILGPIGEIETFWNAIRVAIAPLRWGAGLKGKVLDALAGGVPCLCSPMAAEGMDLPDTLTGLVAATPEDFAAAILRLPAADAEAETLAAAGVAWVGGQFGAERIADLLDAAATGQPAREARQ